VCIGPKRDKQDAADFAGQARGTEREKGTAASRERELRERFRIQG